MVAMANGNVLKSVIGGVIISVVFLYVCTACGPTFHEVVLSVGGETYGSLMVTSLIIIGQPVGYILFFLVQKMQWIGAAIAIVVYAVLYIVLKKNMTKIHDALERQALNPSGKAAPAEE